MATWMQWVVKASLNSSLFLIRILARFLEKCNEEWNDEGNGKQEFQDISAELGARIIESDDEHISYRRPPDAETWEHRDIGFCEKPQSSQKMRASPQSSKTKESTNKRHSDYSLMEQSQPVVHPILPLM